MSELRVLYRHMKIEMPSGEEYDCWLDGRTNTLTFQRINGIGSVETEALDKHGMSERFKDGLVIILGSIAVDPREVQFAGFAHLLSTEVTNLLLARIGQWHTYNDMDDAQAVERLIAQRAYDLACHVSTSTILTAHGDMDKIPDMTAWPKENES